MRHRLLVAVSLVLVSSLAIAEADPTPTIVSLVNTRLIKPLIAKENDQSKFSRARLPPSERRVRVLRETPQQDTAGKAFFAFAVDERRGWSDNDDEDLWTKDRITGCVYPGSGEVFIKRGNAFHPAIAATGKKTKAAPASTCTAAAVLGARS